MKNRAISRILAILLLTSMLASCGEGAVSADTSALSTKEVAETTGASEKADALNERLAIDDELGEYNFNGYDFRIATCNDNTQHYFMEESTGDVVNDAVYNRNCAVEERFNCKIKVINDSGHRETGIFTNSISADEDAIDLICWHVMVLGGHVTNDYFMNWYDIPNVDFDKPWWSDSNINHLTYDSYCPIAIGDFVLSALAKTCCVYYNKTKGLDYNIPDVYETVNNGEWTYDYLISTAKDIYQDLNGNNENDDEDFFGFVSNCLSQVCTYLWAFDNPIYTKKQDVLEFSLDLEKTSAIAEKLLNSFAANPGFGLGKTGVHSYSSDMFSVGKALFANGTINTSLSSFRDMSDDYAILPYPKWDENQKDYYTMVDGSHQVMAVPVTVSDTERVGVIVEALCAESYKTVVPAYYDVALKLKGTRDDKSIEMLDRIVNSRVFDFGYVYDNWLGASFIMQELIQTNNPNFASYWASTEKAIMKHYEKVIKYFESYGE